MIAKKGGGRVYSVPPVCDVTRENFDDRRVYKTKNASGPLEDFFISSTSTYQDFLSKSQQLSHPLPFFFSRLSLNRHHGPHRFSSRQCPGLRCRRRCLFRLVPVQERRRIALLRRRLKLRTWCLSVSLHWYH